jgi:hypothetical protein
MLGERISDDELERLAREAQACIADPLGSPQLAAAWGEYLAAADAAYAAADAAAYAAYAARLKWRRAQADKLIELLEAA